jgi:mevalonate kinase
MIPKGFENLWKQGHTEDLFSLKLCGSGGGGMILGFTKDFQAAKEVLSGYPVHVIQNF